MKYQDNKKPMEISAEEYEFKGFIAEGRAFYDLYATDEKINKPALRVGIISLLVAAIFLIIIINGKYDIFREFILYFFMVISATLCMFAFSSCFFTLKPRGRDIFKGIKWFMWVLSLVAIILVFSHM